MEKAAEEAHSAKAAIYTVPYLWTEPMGLEEKRGSDTCACTTRGDECAKVFFLLFFFVFATYWLGGWGWEGGEFGGWGIGGVGGGGRYVSAPSKTGRRRKDLSGVTHLPLIPAHACMNA